MIGLNYQFDFRYVMRVIRMQLFQPKENGKFGDNIGDIGIEFKTRQIGQQLELINEAKKQNLSLLSEEVKLDDSIPWYASIKLYGNKTNLEAYCILV